MNNKDFVLDMMRRNGAADAVALRTEAVGMDGTAIIAREGAVPDFVPSKDYTGWPAGAPVADDGQVWQLLQPYDSSAHPGRPAELRALWSLCHTTDPGRAKPWVGPLGTSGMYMIGECYRTEDGRVYRCLQDDTIHDAVDLPSAWEEVTV